MNNEELTRILELHPKWLRGEEGGVRADLSWADLSGVYLSGADLRGINLSWASLRGANLSNANLRRADLRGANLSKADLGEVDLSGTYLSGADLSEANLDFSCWPLSCKSTQVKGDENTVGQLLWHALEHAKSSGIEITSLEQLKELANNSSPVVKHGKERV